MTWRTLVPAVLLISLGVPDARPEVVQAVDRVRLTIWLWDVCFADDMDGFLRGEGDMYFASWVRFAGQAPSEAQTTTNEVEVEVDDNKKCGVTTIIFDEAVNVPIPDIDIVIHFWDDDDDTAGKIGKIADSLRDMVPPPGGQLLAGLAKIMDALNDGGNPSRDELGTFRQLLLQPPGAGVIGPPPQLTTHPVMLDGGAGAANGEITLAWEAVLVGSCTKVVDPNDVTPPGEAPDDLRHLEVAQDSHDELVCEARVYGDQLTTVMGPGETRTFSFGIDGDCNRATGCPQGTFKGMEWKLDIVQASDGLQQTTSVQVWHWDGAAWSLTSIQPHDLLVGCDVARVTVHHSDLGAPTPFSSMAAVSHNGVEVDFAPNDPNEIHRLDWIEDMVPPTVPFHSALPDEIDGPVEEIRIGFSEQVNFDPNMVVVLPPVPFTYVMQANTLAMVPVAPLAPGSYQVTVLGILTDLAGNLLDGNNDGVGGDPFTFEFLVPDRRFLPTNATGAPKNVYAQNEGVFVTGSGFQADSSFDVYLVLKDSVEEGGTLLDQTVDGPTVALTLADGTLLPLNISHPDSGDGEYSIVADLNRDGLFQSSVDRLWRPRGIAVSVRLVPIPTVSEWGLIVLTLLLLTAGTLVVGRRRRRQPAAA